MLAGLEPELVTQLFGHVEGDRDGVFGESVDRGDPQRVEHRVPAPRCCGRVQGAVDGAVRGGHQMALKESKGSAQDRQDHSDLQGVDPNRLISLVVVDPQRGHLADKVRPIDRPEEAGWQAPGGAMP